jgi:hypothetical protein
MPLLVFNADWTRWKKGLPSCFAIDLDCPQFAVYENFNSAERAFVSG